MSGRDGSIQSVECTRNDKGLCTLQSLAEDACERCARFARLLDTVQELYGDTVWGVTPEGVLQELDRTTDRLLPEPGDPGYPRAPALVA